MLLILSENTDVYFNLATEEYILHNFSEDVLMLWRSKSAVVCGKHQNLCAEMNFGYCRQNGIQTARRLTGGGTVYHDLGNINFTFIQQLPEGLEKAINFRRFLDPVREALSALGVQTEYSERNDLLLNGKKISGNAEHLFQQQKKVLHHGTLLFDADLTHLKNALHPKGTYIGKAVKSVRSEVANIRSVLPETTTDDFLLNLNSHWLSKQHTNRYVLCEEDVESITRIRDEKYSQLPWIVHYSPNYTINKEIGRQEGDLMLEMAVSNGVIQQLKISGALSESFNHDDLHLFNGKLLNETISADFDLLVSSLTKTSDPFVLF